MEDRLTFHADYHKSGAIIFRLKGELDIYTLAKVREAIALALESSARTLIIDLSELYYIDSSAIGFFIKVDHEAKKKLRYFFIAAPSHEVKRMFKTIFLHRVLNVPDSIEEAITAAGLPFTQKNLNPPDVSNTLK
ncbi:MAG: STAS domain-containing protein [Candidatus Riflebacteria bacterium]|nr:STAS domain-containing protein [Candidatus Riflebacteria bacterium]